MQPPEPPEDNAPKPPHAARAPTPPGPAAPPFVASCQNCTRFLEGNCSLGRVLPPGKLLCGDYEITAAFREQLVRVLMKDIMTQARETAERVTKLRAAQRLWN